MCAGATRKNSTMAELVSAGNGRIYVVGHFKGQPQPDFRLSLTTDVSNTDFHAGYSMTGTVERGSKDGHMETTHYAMIKRKGY